MNTIDDFVPNLEIIFPRLYGKYQQSYACGWRFTHNGKVYGESYGLSDLDTFEHILLTKIYPDAYKAYKDVVAGVEW